MSRRLDLAILASLFTGLVFFVACQDGESPLPPQAQFGKGGGGQADCPGEIEAQIDAIFVNGGNRNAAKSQCANIQKSADDGNTEVGVDQLGQFIEFAADQFNEGDTTGGAQALLDVFSDLAMILALDVTFTEDVLAPGTVEAIATVDADATTVNCETAQCAVDVPEDAFAEEAVLVCKRLADDADPLNTNASQFPRYFDCSAATDLLEALTVEVCVFDPPSSLAPPPGLVVGRVGHNGAEGAFELLPFVAATNVACDNVSLGETGDTGLLARAGGLASRWASWLGLVRPLEAVNPGGLGGLAGSLSPFGGVATGIDDGFEMTPTAWSASGGTANTAWRRTDFNAMGDPSGIQNQAFLDGLVVLASGDGTNGFLPAADGGAWVSWYGDETLPAVRTTGNYIGTSAGEANGSLSGGTSTKAHYGRWTSDPILVPSESDAPTLRFRTWWEIESVDAPTFDLMRVIVIDVDSEGAETVLGVLNPEIDVNGAPSQPFTSGGFDAPPAWVTVNESLDGFQDRVIRVAFEFATGDPLYNGFRGWIVDNVEVFDAGAVVTSQTLQSQDQATATLNPVPPAGSRQ